MVARRPSRALGVQRQLRQLHEPPTPIIAGDAIYPLRVNAEKARRFGLGWIVSTDHGGPNHSKLDANQRCPSLLEARRRVPQVLQFYGMELDTPAADHSSLIIPKVGSEREILFDLERRFSAKDPYRLIRATTPRPRCSRRCG